VLAAFIRFICGLGGAVAVGALVFRMGVIDPQHPAFECLSAGALGAGIFALVRQSTRGQAFVLALVFAMMRLAVSPVARLSAVIGGLFLGLGLFLVALIYDRLARDGWRFGKFLLIGPMIGGLYLGLAPLTEGARMHVNNASSQMLFRFALGLLIGQGLAIGMELADLPFAGEKSAVPETGSPNAARPY
jgi:hypothetical protein